MSDRRITNDEDQILTDVYGCVFCDKQCEVTMELNMKDKTLKYNVDGKDQGVPFKDVFLRNDEVYSMCISLDEEMAIELKQYQHIV